MKHLSSILLAAAFVAAGATACFDDPVSDLRNGPALIQLTRAAITLRTGDSLDVSAEIKDEAGNVLDAGSADWASADVNIATVREDTVVIPGNAFNRAFIVARATGGGVTRVSVTSGALTNSFRVLVLPAILAPSALPAVSGTVGRDTIAVTLPGGTVVRDIFDAGDTVAFTVASGSNVYFNTNSQVSFGPRRAWIVERRDSTRLKAVASEPFRGRPWVTSLRYNGPIARPDSVGTVQLDSLRADSIVVAHPRFNGTLAFAPANDTVWVRPPAGARFATNSGIRFGGSAAIVLTRSDSVLKGISPVDYTGLVTVTNLLVGSGTIDSVKTNASYTMAKATFGGSVTAGGQLLDTVKVYGTSLFRLTTTPAASVSNVIIGGATAWVLRRTADSMYVISRMPNTGTITVTNVTVSGNIIPQLNTTQSVTINETPTGEANEPANDAPGAVTIDFSAATSTNPYVIYGAIADAGDVDDLFAFTLAAARTVTIQLQFAGTGGGGATNPDIDLLVCNAACSAWTSTAGATANQPEAITLTNLAAGTYNIYVNGWDTGGATRPYKLIVY